MEDDDGPLGAEDPDEPPSLDQLARAVCISFWITATVCIDERVLQLEADSRRRDLRLQTLPQMQMPTIPGFRTFRRAYTSRETPCWQVDAWLLEVNTAHALRPPARLGNNVV